MTALHTATNTATTILAEQCDSWCGPRWPWFPLIPLLFIAFWITFIATVGRRRWRHDERRSGEAVLAERYARGEIDDTEYNNRRDVLRHR